jgi:hypothetical protein
MVSILYSIVSIFKALNCVLLSIIYIMSTMYFSNKGMNKGTSVNHYCYSILRIFFLWGVYQIFALHVLQNPQTLVISRVCRNKLFVTPEFM